MSYSRPPNDPKTHPQLTKSKGPTERKDFRLPAGGPGTAIVRDSYGNPLVVGLVQPQEYLLDQRLHVPEEVDPPPGPNSEPAQPEVYSDLKKRRLGPWYANRDEDDEPPEAA